MKRYIFIVILILLIGAAGFILPIKFMEWQDAKRLEKIEIEAATKVMLSTQMDMTLIEKIQLMTNEKVSKVALVNGKNYNQSNIEEKLKEELQKLNELGILELDVREIRYGESWLRMYVDPEDGGKSMLLWKAYLVTEDYELVLSMDDGTGKIIDIEKQYYYSQDDDFRIKSRADELVNIAEKWGEYLGCTLIESYYGNDKKIVEKLDIYATDIDGKYVVIYGDEGGDVIYLFQRNMENVVFSVKIYM